MNDNEERNLDSQNDSQNRAEANDDSDNSESRREMLAKIGAALALAVVPLEGNAVAEGQTQQRTSGPQPGKMVVTIPLTVHRAFGSQFEGQRFQVYFTHPDPTRGQVLAIPASDTASVRQAEVAMKGAISFTATVKNGLVEVDLARQTVTHCIVNTNTTINT
jgi:hypothetical protein